MSGALVAMLLASRAAHAQEQSATSATDSASADALFNEGKQLMSSGDYANACPKLAESLRLDPGSGTLTALAVCHDHLGLSATAWSEFTDVAATAQKQGRADRVAFARQNIARLEPLLARLTIRVPADVAGTTKLQIRRDASVVGQGSWGAAVPVDPGDHVIEASAPDKDTWSVHVTVGASEKKEVAVPMLRDAAPVAANEPANPSVATPQPNADVAPSGKAESSSQRTIAFVVGGAGAAFLVVGGAFGVDALSKSSDAKQKCSMSPCASLDAVNENSSAKTSAHVADVALGAGLVALGVGGYLFLTSPKATPAPGEAPPAASGVSWRLGPTVGFGRAGFAVDGRF